MTSNFNLFCLPHAGGNKYAYQPFIEAAPDFIDVKVLEYPGRGEKSSQALITDAISLAELMLNEIRDQLGTPYSIYGHSMGTLIGLLLLRKIEENGLKMPEFVFFTGSEGPRSRKFEKDRHLLPKDELIEELRLLGGVTEDVLNEPDIMDFFLPIIRADFQAIESFKYFETAPLNVPMTIAIGTQEKVSSDQAKSWQHETRFPLEIMQFHGNHFFIFDHAKRILNLISEKVMEHSQ